ncbi:MAG: PD-(D/E)XK nuclease family protein, partial [Bacteroidota bacterium]
MIDALRKQITSPVFSPKILRIEDFVGTLSGLKHTDSIEVLFEFYQVYVNECKQEEPQTFEIFANWGKTLLQDFNEIDRYLIDPNKILKYLDDIEEIKHWSVTAEPKSELVKKHLDFWKLLPNYYASLYKHLLQKKRGYQGMIYRQALIKLKENISDFQKKKIIFAGFNALNAAEETIFQELQINANAKIYWDIDEYFLLDSGHDAGLFIRKYKRNWS